MMFRASKSILFNQTIKPLRYSTQNLKSLVNYTTSSEVNYPFTPSFTRHTLPSILRTLGIVTVPQQSAYVVERFGRYQKTLEPGLHFIIPIIEQVSYLHSLKEEIISIPNQTAITRDNVTLQIDGVLYTRIKDAYDASYGVNNPLYAVMQLAQTTMRSELGKLTLDETFLERASLNAMIVKVINEASQDWGIECLRYEIKDIHLPSTIKNAMERQAESERKKRADILQSEGRRESEINLAKGQREASILQAEGEAAAIRQRADATAYGVEILSEAILKEGSQQAISLQIAEQYVQAFSKLANTNNSMIIPADIANSSSMIAQALSIYKAVEKTVPNTISPQNTPKIQ